MVRLILTAALGAFAVTGCAATNTAYPRPVYSSPVSPSPSAPSPYRTVARAPLHSELFACGSWGSNLGEIGFRREFVQYTPYIDTPAGPLLRTPTEGACLSSGFGLRGAATGGGRQHNGVDLANPSGGYIYAAGEGRILFADYRNGFGNMVEIDHGRSVRTLYAHLSEFDPDLRPGSFVYAGQAIGRMGMTGNATGVHLHYEVYVDGMIVDPLHYGRPPVYVSAPAPEDAWLPDESRY